MSLMSSFSMIQSKEYLFSRKIIYHNAVFVTQVKPFNFNNRVSLMISSFATCLI